MDIRKEVCVCIYITRTSRYTQYIKFQRALYISKGVYIYNFLFKKQHMYTLFNFYRKQKCKHFVNQFSSYIYSRTDPLMPKIERYGSAINRCGGREYNISKNLYDQTHKYTPKSMYFYLFIFNMPPSLHKDFLRNLTADISQILLFL